MQDKSQKAMNTKAVVHKKVDKNTVEEENNIPEEPVQQVNQAITTAAAETVETTETYRNKLPKKKIIPEKTSETPKQEVGQIIS